MKKAIVFITFLLTHSLAFAEESNDYEYKIAIAYLSGAKGETTTTKVIPECAYDRCKGLTKKITITKKDYKKALYWLNKSVEQGYYPAASKAYALLYKQLNYKQKIPDKYLLKLMQKRFGLRLSDYNRLIHKYIKLMQISDKCKANYYLFEIYKNGYFDIVRNIEEAKKYKKKIDTACPKDSYWAVSSTI